jgi:hypothetical protein
LDGSNKKSGNSAAPYKPTDRERHAIERVNERRARTAPAPRFNLETSTTKSVNITADHIDPETCYTLLADTFGSGDYEIAAGLLTQLTDASRTGKDPTRRELNFMLSVVRGINPRDETEALLATQMAAVHNATMVSARRLNHVETIPQQDSAVNMLNKLARTFTGQVEALKRYRSAGEQTIKVQHVTVNDGGQAIVGNVSQGGGDLSKSEGQPHVPCAKDECGPALLGHEQAVGMQMPGASSTRLDGMPVPRRARRGAKG